MTQTGLTGRKISEKLDKKLIQEGGVTIIDLPTIECGLATEHETQTVEMFGYRSIIVYNKHREKQHKKDKENKRYRSLKRQIKIEAGRSIGEGLPTPSLEILLDSCKRKPK